MIEKKDIEEIRRIVQSIKSGADETDAFTTYLTKLCGTEDQSFSNTKWPAKWRGEVYSFGSIFLDKNAGPYLKIANQFLKENNPCEVAAFFYSEIIWNYYEETSVYNEKALASYIATFPHNPEFHNSYGIFLAAKYNFQESLHEHKAAIRLDNKNNIFVDNYILAAKQYFEHLLRKEETIEADRLINETISFIDSIEIQEKSKTLQIERLTSLQDRLNDFQIVLDSISRFNEHIQTKIRNEQKRLIEILGIFSAILAFIFTNVKIALSNLDTAEVLSLMFGMALVLMIFGISISILFSYKEKTNSPSLSFLRESRLWAIIVLTLGLLFWIYLNYAVPIAREDSKGTELENTEKVTLPTQATTTNQH